MRSGYPRPCAYVTGETLRDRVDREKQLPVDEALGIATSAGGRGGPTPTGHPPATVLVNSFFEELRRVVPE